MDWPEGQGEESIPGRGASVCMAAEQGHAAPRRLGVAGVGQTLREAAARRLEEAVDASCAAKGLGMTLLERQVGKMASVEGKAGAALRSLTQLFTSWSRAPLPGAVQALRKQLRTK